VEQGRCTSADGNRTARNPTSSTIQRSQARSPGTEGSVPSAPAPVSPILTDRVGGRCGRVARHGHGENRVIGVCRLLHVVRAGSPSRRSPLLRCGAAGRRRRIVHFVGIRLPRPLLALGGAVGFLSVLIRRSSARAQLLCSCDPMSRAGNRPRPCLMACRPRSQASCGVTPSGYVPNISGLIHLREATADQADAPHITRQRSCHALCYARLLRFGLHYVTARLRRTKPAHKRGLCAPPAEPSPPALNAARS
jgi:hypothetical protein